MKCDTVSRSVSVAVLAVVVFFTVSSAGCAPENLPAKRFSDILQRYPGTDEPLRISELSASALGAIESDLRGKNVTIIVHPAYSLFFRDERKNTYSEAKYDLLKLQLDNEARFISSISKTSNILILILPGNYTTDSTAPASYTAYLNSVTRAKSSVFYLFSETSSSGALPLHAVVTLYSVLQDIKPSKIFIGGGYIGRCQREFHNQLVTYLDNVPVYIVPEISSISPDDISDKEAQLILNGLRINDYTMVEKFIERRGYGRTTVLPLPPAHAL